MRFAIIGAGVIGQVHAVAIEALRPRAELVFVADPVKERARSLAAMHSADSGSSLADVQARGDIDAVAICTPSGAHADLAVAALDSGMHIVVEKPLDVTMETARRVLDAQRRTKRVATVISQHRFDPASRLVQRCVQAGLFGAVTSGVATVPWWRTQDYYDSAVWRGTRALDGGGALINQGIHTLDLLVWLLGDPVEVFAWTGCLAHERIEVEDTAVATVRFASGALGVVHATTSAYPGLTTRLQVHGTRGSATIDGDRLVSFHVAPSAADPNVAAAVDQAAELLVAPAASATAGADPTALSDAHTAQYQDFLDAVTHGWAPTVTLTDAIRTLTVVDGVYRSARHGSPVHLQHP